jgi:prepilin-type processing-associated H-X9-DG protein
MGLSLLAWAGSGGYIVGRHGTKYNTSNFLFVDGHVTSRPDGQKLTQELTTQSGLTSEPFNFDME